MECVAEGEVGGAIDDSGYQLLRYRSGRQSKKGGTDMHATERLIARVLQQDKIIIAKRLLPFVLFLVGLLAGALAPDGTGGVPR
jgi:hypothetical protein